MLSVLFGPVSRMKLYVFVQEEELSLQVQAITYL